MSGSNPIVARLRAELDEANETIRQLRHQRTSDPTIGYGALRLSRAEKVVIERLYSACPSTVHRGDLRDVIDVRLNRTDAVSCDTVDVVICRLRRKFRMLRAPAISISTEWGEGSFLSVENRDRLDEIRIVAPKG